MSPSDFPAPARESRVRPRRDGLVGLLLDAGHTWGRVDVVPAARSVWMHTRLTVYPPGTNARERRLLRLHRDWPLGAAVVGLFSMLAMSPTVGVGPSVVAIAVGFAGGLAITSHLTRGLREGAARVDCIATMAAGVYVIHGDQRLLEESRHALLSLESRFERGDLSPVEFEAGWTRVYRRIKESGGSAG